MIEEKLENAIWHYNTGKFFTSIVQEFQKGCKYVFTIIVSVDNGFTLVERTIIDKKDILPSNVKKGFTKLEYAIADIEKTIKGE